MVEDASDTLLIRSRAEAQLARLHTDADRLTTLHDALTAADARAPLCAAPEDDGDGGALLSLEYSRGSARVTLANVALPAAGTYAVSALVNSMSNFGTNTFVEATAAHHRDGRSGGPSKHLVELVPQLGV